MLAVLGQIKPAFELEPTPRIVPSLYGKETPYSAWLRKGLVQLLALIALYGDSLKLALQPTAQCWVDFVIRPLFNKATGWLWCSFDDILPDVAEASPEAVARNL